MLSYTKSTSRYSNPCSLLEILYLVKKHDLKFPLSEVGNRYGLSDFWAFTNVLTYRTPQVLDMSVSSVENPPPFQG